jgi:acetylglutamate kinase
MPVAHLADGTCIGVEAVIDKAHASGLLAAELQADAFLMLTDVPAVYTGWGTPAQRALGGVTPQELAALDFASAPGAAHAAVIHRCKRCLDLPVHRTWWNDWYGGTCGRSGSGCCNDRKAPS